MIRVSDLSEIKSKELLPQATLLRPVSYFTSLFRTHSMEGHDDLDYYQGVAFVLDDMVPFALMHYRGYPEDTTTVYLPFGIQGPKEVSTILARIVSETDVPTSAIIWQREASP